MIFRSFFKTATEGEDTFDLYTQILYEITTLYSTTSELQSVSGLILPLDRLEFICPVLDYDIHKLLSMNDNFGGVSWLFLIPTNYCLPLD